MLQKTTASSNASSNSKEQKKFQELLERIQLLKDQIEVKKQLASKVHQLRNEVVMPLMLQLLRVKISQVRALDWAFERIAIAKRLKHRLREDIADRINELIYSFELDTEQESEILFILAKHSGISEDELLLEKKENEEIATREYLRTHFGIELDLEESADLKDPEVQEKIRAKIEEESKRQKKGFNTNNNSTDKADELQEKLSKSIRSVYATLVKFLHPDKELDEQKKLEKTEAIKEVTIAYENKDMLSLLILQAKYGISEDSIDESNLKTYSKILTNQLKDLEKEHDSIIHATQGIPISNQKALDKFFKSEKTNLKKHIKYEQSLLQSVFEDEDQLIEYLKQGY